MPVAAGAKIIAADIPIEEWPICRLVQAVAQSIPDNGVITPLTFTTEDIDTHGFHDPVTNNTRITPNVAGHYRFTGVYFSATITTPVYMSCFVRKNAATNLPSGGRAPGTGSSPSVSASVIVAMNGTTDYVELCALQDSSAAFNTVVSAYLASTFECEYLRPL